MKLKHLSEYRDRYICQRLVEKIWALSHKKIRLMEVCGTHTMSISRSGIRGLLPETITLVSGPGCPVCVTSQNEIARFITLARREGLIITTFGDLLKVPASGSSLEKERAEGADVRVVYSVFDSIEIARKNPGREVVFLGIGFETTAPTIAAALIEAKDKGLKNFFVISACKQVPPALQCLMENTKVNIHGFLCPGHVSAIIGGRAYLATANNYHIPCVVTGFEPADILDAIYRLVRQINQGKAGVENAYQRVVTFEGNKKAQEVMAGVFEKKDAVWRGLGVIRGSGLGIREEFGTYDAENVFDMNVPESTEPKGCACGDILTGVKIPPECPLYKRSCTPIDPIGPCMVSSEGTCAAYYRYYDKV